MTVTVENADGIQVVALEGRLDSMNASSVEGELNGLVTAEHNRVVVDMAKLDYISSAGLRVILVMAKQVKQVSGKLVLCGMQSHIREVFEISGFLSILTVVETRGEALSSAA
jgi:anti-anti-sigma factor